MYEIESPVKYTRIFNKDFPSKMNSFIYSTNMPTPTRKTYKQHVLSFIVYLFVFSDNSSPTPDEIFIGTLVHK